ncbi:DUF4398 domain-containing protein [Persicimonas caeni]|uniref:DUF4398 domain-containing protein n=1 Tax=Persicimonas caeni TaxID=2292766 RepID=A0A4Y6PMR1_PERCE|nr:DUF4398 domain-containing protein [Persicimonas caeni]QDG49572.1 DUF4398 domain-containing protein [Persicimonas caeni]QED30793.1 DUF4398 domain-containing protein [Persicimonas caeni]
MQRLLSIPIVALALAILPMVGCATADSTQVTAKDYAKPRETIRAAQEIGANTIPQAKLYLSYAVDEVNKANRYLKKGQNYEARLSLARAQADADLALTLAKERRMVQQVRQIENRIERLENQIE